MLTALLSPTAALRHARSETALYRFGGGWIAATYDQQARAWRQGQIQPYAAARAEHQRDVIARAAHLLGLDADKVNHYLDNAWPAPCRQHLFTLLRQV